MNSLEDVVARAEDLMRNGQPQAVLDLMEDLTDNPGLSVPGRLLFARALRGTGRLPEAVQAANDLLRDHPDEAGAWEIVLFAALGQPGFTPLAFAFLSALRNWRQIRRKSLRRPLVHALILTCPADSAALARKALDNDILSAAEAEVVAQATGFLRKLAQALAKQSEAPDSWSLGLCGTDQAVLFQGSHASVDLSHFRGGEEQGWTAEYAAVLARAVIALLPHDRFDDTDASRVSGPTLTKADHLPAMLLSPLLDLPRALQGQDPNVRSAGRPVTIPQGALVLRAGWIEAWTLAGWAKDRPGARSAARAASIAAQDAIATGSDFRDPSPIWPRRDLYANAVYLTTNAGWYARPETAAACFQDWASRYVAALLAGQLIVDCAEVLQRLATHLPALRQKPLHDWSAPAFLAAIQGKRLVLATPFWREIAEHWASGRLTRLWRAAGLDLAPAQIVTVAAPVSTWPNRPDADWTASFASLQQRCQQAIETSGAEVFIASCGCYGLPIVHAMHGANPGLTGIYYGHASNAWFGILTNDAARHELFRRAPDPALWARVNLDQTFPGLARIDDGRYVLDQPAQG